ncbi:hypothetical protein [Nocardioides montaniterrae]
MDPHLAEQVSASRTWRSEYIESFASLTALSADPVDAVGIAAAGLDSMRRRMRLRQGDDEVPLSEASYVDQVAPATVRVEGSASPAVRLEIPYRGTMLSGSRLRDQLHCWLEAGVVEPGFVSSIEPAPDDSKRRNA